MKTRRLAEIALLGIVLAGALSGCGKSNSTTFVVLSPNVPQSVDQGQSKDFTAFVENDPVGKGVTWSLSGTTCTGSACGTLSNTTSTSTTYVAPTGLANTLTVTLTATAVIAASKKATVSISVTPPPTIITTSLPAGLNGTPYNQQILASGGVAPLVFTLAAGSLPAGLNLGTNGDVSGRPSSSGTSNFTVQVADQGTPPLTVTQALSITISPPPPLSISTTSLPAGSQGSPYNQPLAASGGVPPLTWSIASGGLPPGLTLDATTGQISGTPTTQGPFSFTVQVADSAIPQQTATQPLSISIGAPQPLSIATTTLQSAVTGTLYSATLNASGGVPPFTWSITSGLLPSGLSLNPSTGDISGTPTAAGTANFTVEVSDSENPSRTAPPASLSLQVTAGTSNDSLLKGNYVFLFNGFNAKGSVVTGGVFTADGSGNLTNGIEDVNQDSGVSQNLSLTGTYAIAADGRGSFTTSVIFVGSPSGSSTTVTSKFQFAIDGNGNAQFIEFDSTGTRGTGILKKQTLGSFSAANFNGTFAFGLAGADSSGKRAAIAGVFHADGIGSLTDGNADVDDAGTVAANLTGGSGEFAVNANGRGTASITLPIPATLTFNFYMVSPSEILFAGVDPVSSTNPRVSGEALLQTQAAFDNTALNGASVFTATGLDASGDASVLGGLLSASGGNISATTDANDGGVISSDVASSGFYSVAANGRVALSGLGSQLAVMYLVGPNEAFVLGNDVAATSGIAEPQVGASFTDSSFAGTFTLGPPSLGSPGTAETAVSDVAGSFAADGAGNISGKIDDSGANALLGTNEKFTATYSVGANGRGTITTNAPAGLPAQLVLYLVSPTEIRVVSADPADTHPQVLFFDH